MPIPSLPAELVRNIGSYLDVFDWCALRLTYRSLFINLLDAFATRHFIRNSVLITSMVFTNWKRLPPMAPSKITVGSYGLDPT